MKKFIALACAAALGVAAIGSMVACGGGGDRAAETDSERTVTMWLHKSQAEEEGKVYDTLVKNFNKEDHIVDGKKVNIQIEYVNTAETLTKRIATAKINHELADIIPVDAPGIARLAHDRTIAPIGQYVTDEIKNDYVDSVITQSTYNGELYALSGMDAPAGFIITKRCWIKRA